MVNKHVVESLLLYNRCSLLIFHTHSANYTLKMFHSNWMRWTCIFILLRCEKKHDFYYHSLKMLGVVETKSEFSKTAFKWHLQLNELGNANIYSLKSIKCFLKIFNILISTPVPPEPSWTRTKNESVATIEKFICTNSVYRRLAQFPFLLQCVGLT